MKKTRERLDALEQKLMFYQGSVGKDGIYRHQIFYLNEAIAAIIDYLGLELEKKHEYEKVIAKKKSGKE